MKLSLSGRFLFDFGSVELENIARIAFENATDLFKGRKIDAECPTFFQAPQRRVAEARFLR